ncbi:hypothetical protein VNI00_003969 [Paramarasmius palmivorus]|uniref:Protein FAM72A n=1 Tax=Paramarasmius palmivorus TaxID=297713 RepID=A0AAW0DRS2_9AGAR
MFSPRQPPVWQQSQLHLFPHNPYPPTLPPPQPIAHKAVLLLHPNVALYSSDALPVNCSAYTTNPDVLKPATSCRPPARTCECLTQTLCCHGCGSTVGYMIVIPCTRCTSSITATNRATNGHRFVFHSSEVAGLERRYVPDEPGVIPYDMTLVPMSPTSGASSELVYSPSSPSISHYDSVHYARTRQFSGSSTSSMPPLEYLPTPPVDIADLSPASSTTSSPISGSFPFSGQHTRSPSLAPSPSDDSVRQFMYRHANSTFVSPELSSPSPPPPPIMHSHPQAYGLPSEPLEWSSVKLKGGDILHWHHLIRHGEIPGVADDPRARKTGGSRANSPPAKFPLNR